MFLGLLVVRSPQFLKSQARWAGFLILSEVISSQHGGIYRKPKEEHRGQKENELANPYKTERADIKDLLIAKANQDIYLPKEEYSSPSRNH